VSAGVTNRGAVSPLSLTRRAEVSSQEQEVKAMRRHLVLTEVVVSLTLAATAGLRAHHAIAAEFDASKPVNFKGTVIKMQWTNCHVWLSINVTEADGTTEPRPLKPARRMSSSGEALRRSLCCQEQRSSSMGIRRRMGRGEPTAGSDVRRRSQDVSGLLRHRRAVRTEARRRRGALDAPRVPRPAGRCHPGPPWLSTSRHPRRFRATA